MLAVEIRTPLRVCVVSFLCGWCVWWVCCWVWSWVLGVVVVLFVCVAEAAVCGGCLAAVAAVAERL
jgi:hypothetical protein